MKNARAASRCKVVKNETRQLLLHCAMQELVANKGTLEIGDVTKRAGVSAGAPYHHFGSKSGLIAAVVDDFYERYDTSVMNVEIAGRHWATREETRVKMIVEFHYNDPLSPIILSQLSRDPIVAQVEARWLSAHIAKGARNIANGQRDGDISNSLDPELAAAMILGGLRQTIVHALARKTVPRRGALARELWAFVLAVSRANPALRKGRR